YRPVLAFNYLGRFDLAEHEPSPGGIGLDRGDTVSGTARLDVTAFVTAAGELEFEWTYSPGAHGADTVGRLARETVAALREIAVHCAHPDSGGCTPSDFPLAGLDQAELDRVTGNGRHVEDVYPLTPMQAGMLFHSLSEPGTYLEQVCLTLSDAADLGARLPRAWQQVVDSVPALRTALAWPALREPVQVVYRTATLPIERYDWTGLPAAEHDDALRDLLARDRAAGLDLTRPPLLRVALVRLGGAQLRVVWTFHHIVLDGWSTFQVLSDVLAAAGGTPPMRRRPFADHLAWLSRQDTAAAERHWRGVLAGLRAPTPLPFDRPPGPAHVTHSASTVDAELPVPDSAALYEFARRHRVTVNVVVQGMWATVLARRGGGRDVCFGAVVSGRPAELAGVDAMVGMFVNTVPVRVRVGADQDLPGWLRRLQADQVDARRFEHVSLARLHRCAGLPAGVNLFDSIVAFENYPFDQDRLAGLGLRIETVAAVEITNYPLNLIAHGGARHADRLTFRFGYDPALFDDATIQALADELVGLLKDVANGTAALVTPPVATAAVPEPVPVGPRPYVAPRTRTEEVVARIWSEVLAVDRVGADDDFFALGGDSILSIRVAARLQGEFGTVLPPRALFDNPTVGALALMFEHPTVETMARLVDRRAGSARDYQL
ncbi:MAG TPA: condensation domain-containing protein, partial [Pseudonocardiaceae bacterium]|nr:condensation domain-containing protein [Pseudonocardiaceae bacterium]